MKRTRTNVTLISANENVNNLTIQNVSAYRVGYKLIWIEYNNGESIMAVKRTDYAHLYVNTCDDVVIAGDEFERVNCSLYDD